ncbi:pentapeptide repeat-containing protein [Paenibacillus sp. ClWae2A]|uniref:pentapeptide repeat-containing protein n=1 Tax=Paenibacillus sp. ClWae2A TaxID=3057177 RepID=UPI0037C7A6CE
MNGVRLARDDFWETEFKRATIIDCNFSASSFSLTDFSNASLINIDISESRFEGVSFYGATLKNMKGITEANFHSINVGTPDNPTVLLGQDAAKWLEATVDE